MKVWYWCPSCYRAFLAEASEPERGALRGLLTDLGTLRPSPVDCPYSDCGATARVVMTWQAARRWAAVEYGQQLPAIPVPGQAYEVPGTRFLPGAAGRGVRRG
ncbi:MAG: hypothetical protein ACODAJ_00220 [Planctomycetota bacterium]